MAVLQAMQNLVRRVAGNNAELKPDAEQALMNVVEEMTKSAINFACGIASRRQGRAKEIQTADLAVYLERTRCAAEVMWGNAVSERQRSEAVKTMLSSFLGLLSKLSLGSETTQ